MHDRVRGHGDGGPREAGPSSVLAGTAAVGACAAVVPSTALRFGAGAVVVLICAAVVLRRDRAGSGTSAGLPSARAIGVLMAARGTSWLLFAAAAATGGLGLPAAGDWVNPLTGCAAIAVTALAAGVAAGRRGTRRLATVLTDVTMAAAAVMLGLWTAVLRPAVDTVGPDVVGWAAALSAVFVVQVVAAVLIVGGQGLRRVAFTVAALIGITVADVVVLLSALDGSRGAPVAAVVAWVTMWPLLAHRVIGARFTELPPTRMEHVRGAAHASNLITVIAGLGVLAAVVGWASGRAGSPSDPVSVVLMLAALAAFVGRELLFGTDRLRLLGDLSEQALRDPWTGLANRRALSDRIRSLPPGREWVIVAVDLDGFKTVNDVHGHGVGDDVLAVAADVLRALTPADGLAARTGGDEFAVLLPGDVERGRELGRLVVRDVPVALAALRLAPTITASVGVGRLVPGTIGDAADAADADGARDAGDAGLDPLSPLVEAAAALREAKAGGRNRVQVYPGHVARLRERRILVETRLRAALRDGGVGSVGQPVVDLGTGRVVGVEALARWQDDVLGDVPPSEFVAVAEECGLVGDLGRQVLRSALSGYVGTGLVGTGLRLAVNVSPTELRCPGYVESTSAELAAAGFAPSDLTFEVTEAVLIAEDDPAVRVLAVLGDLGVRLAIDDFGTGYAALGYLRRLPVHSLKIDRSLLLEARTGVRSRHIMAGMVALAKRLGLTVTVEGIEDEQAAVIAAGCGADAGQGWWFGRPVPWDAFAATFREQPLTRSAQEPDTESSVTISR